jgi:glyoxylase-like metal-dependent hydrolase (beta-lactamase superfamily II)/rhodanese-related sulfurtransferase
MKIEQIYTGCLAEAAYYIESKGEIAIIDPLRDVDAYVEMAKKNNATIKYIFETHFHADFVSGHIDLALKTGAKIVYGPTTMETGFDTYIGKDGEVFQLGDIKIKLIHTPGHTMESSCFLLSNEEDKELALFTGDTLFIGDVGRPDLAQKVIAELTQDRLANHLFDSLRNKIMPLSDDIIVYPGHGAGSACGKNMSKETTDTLGNQKKVNYALRADMTREEFINELLTGLTPPPGYFPQNVLLNIQGYKTFDAVMEHGLTPLTCETFEQLAKENGAIIIDTREANDFVKGFVPNSINIGVDGNFAVWVGTLIPHVKQPILFIADKGREKEVITRLSRVGYDNILGFLEGGIESWKKANKELDIIQTIDANSLANKMDHETLTLVDVRKASEFYSERVIDALNAPLDYLNDSMKKLDASKTYFIHCAGGYRSVVFISILQARGFRNLINVTDGFTAIKNTHRFPLTEYVCPTTML